MIFTPCFCSYIYRSTLYTPTFAPNTCSASKGRERSASRARDYDSAGERGWLVCRRHARAYKHYVPISRLYDVVVYFFCFTRGARSIGSSESSVQDIMIRRERGLCTFQLRSIFWLARREDYYVTGRSEILCKYIGGAGRETGVCNSCSGEREIHLVYSVICGYGVFV